MIIGITGKKRAGKDTLAAALVERGFKRMAFADPIRAFVEDIIGEPITDDNKEAPIPWLGGHSPRTMMQTIGTEWGRDRIHPDLWLRSLMRKVGAAKADGAGIVISDVRFENEAAAIRQHGGLIIHVRRPSPYDTDPHVSEAGIKRSGNDCTLYNDRDYDSYKETCARFAQLAMSLC